MFLPFFLFCVPPDLLFSSKTVWAIMTHSKAKTDPFQFSLSGILFLSTDGLLAHCAEQHFSTSIYPHSATLSSSPCQVLQTGPVWSRTHNSTMLLHDGTYLMRIHSLYSSSRLKCSFNAGCTLSSHWILWNKINTLPVHCIQHKDVITLLYCRVIINVSRNLLQLTCRTANVSW
jgi:hypothetical protein